MTILSVVQDVCAVVGVTLPSSLFSGITSNRTMQEMLSLANEMAQRIAYDNREWTMMKGQQTFTGNGTQTDFTMPVDFKRMLLTANVWRSTSTQSPMRFISDTDEWMQRRSVAYVDAWGEWTRLGDKMLIYPAMGTGITAKFAFLKRNCITLAAGGLGDRFQSDNDVYLLDERILKLGMIWQWKANKGSPYAEDMGTYNDALAVYAGADKPAPIIVGRKNASDTISTTYPWPVPT